MAWSSLVDMAMTPEEQADWGSPEVMREAPEYPYGLCICLTDADLKKLDLDADCEIGDLIDMRCFAVVTSVSKNRKADGTGCARVELTIQKMKIENEMDEDERK